ncbi:MAG: diguanylate cyclase (GGDEF)-like protein [Glaciecola sp.]|jgi:diguanylate cyclase (GGDEF)-like protein
MQINLLKFQRPQQFRGAVGVSTTFTLDICHRVARAVGFFICIGLLSSNHTVEASPVVKEPVFQRLSTANGLSQDTVNTLLIDSDGFLWLGTEAGLNRFDGYQNIQIAGPNNEFTDMPISSLFQDSRGIMWVSEYNAGIHQYNLKSNQAKLIISEPSTIAPDYVKVANHITEDSEGNIWFSLDESLVWYSYETQNISKEFTLPAEMLEDHLVRTHLILPDILIIGSSAGLFAINRDTKAQSRIEFVSEVDSNLDNQNVKTLLTDDRDNLWIGTVEGLYLMPIKTLVDQLNGEDESQKATLMLADRNIWNISVDETDILHIATDQGYFQLNSANEEVKQIFVTTASRYPISNDVLKSVIIDKNNNLWFGSGNDGAFYWTHFTTQFKSVFNRFGERGDKSLSNNNVWSLYQEDDETLWVGTQNGLNRYNLITGKIQQFMVSEDTKAQFSASSIIFIHPTNDGRLWLHTGDGLIQFDTKTNQSLLSTANSKDDEAKLAEYIWSSYLKDDGDFLLITDSSFLSYSPSSGKVSELEKLNSLISPAEVLGFKAGFKEDTTWVSAYGALWEMNNSTGELKLIHQLGSVHKKARIYPSDVILDDNNILWISYSSLGLFGLDANTYEQKYFFNKTNLLPSNVIFDLNSDRDGNIWMGSNTGLLRLSDNTLQLERFDHNHGLANSDFNLDASIVLRDGRMVYGSPKGITIFDPQKIEPASTNARQATITSLTLSTNPIDLPFTALNGQTVELSHDDVGLNINFSTLQYENQQSVKYKYQLSGDENIVYPNTNSSHIMFPKLEPGQYQFSVTVFDVQNDTDLEPAVLNIHVRYPPFSSPIAYVVYIIIFLTMIAVLWQNKRKQNELLASAHQQTLESRDRLTLALNASNSGVWEYNINEDLFWVNELGANATQQQTKSFDEQLAAINPSDKQRYESAWQTFLQTPHLDLDITYRLLSEDDNWFWYRDVGKKVKFDNNGSPLVVTGTYTNVTKSVVDNGNLRLFGEAFKHTLDWVIIYNSQYHPIAYNDAFKKKFKIEDEADAPSELSKVLETQASGFAKTWQKLYTLKAGEHWKGEDKIILADAKTYDILVHINAVPNEHQKDKIEHILVIISDITDQKSAESKLRLLANYDSLTGLPNRALLLDRIDRAIEHAQRIKNNLAVFFIDLDKFKQVNDSLGHKAGDELLKVIAKRLTDKLRKEDTVARLGGDEFVIMVEEVKSVEDISMLVSEISQTIDLPIKLGSQSVSVSSSIGITLYPSDGKTADELLKNADIAMYHAKEKGRSNFQFFTQHMNDLVKDRLELENRLKEANKEKAFTNHYQPIIDIKSKAIEGFEILMRWESNGTMIPPDVFIPVSEELGFINSMTLDAIERAMPILKTLYERGFTGYLSFNLSAKHFENKSSINHIIALLENNDVPVNAIRFEITESALMRDYDKALTYMTYLREKGFLIALDDFGTGYSSLKYLKEFPINIIKIDKSFVDDIGKDKNNEAIILTTLSMAKQLNMSCIAEGIETIEHVHFFNKHKCYHLQGYYFSKPIPGQQVIALLDNDW